MYLIKKRIYPLSEKQLKILQEYLNKELNLEKIQKLQSLAEYLIIFISKKNSSLRLCIDY